MDGYIIQSEKSKITFFNKSDYLHFKDFLENGLKVIRKDGRTIYFNDGSKLIDVSIPTENEKRYILCDRRHKTMTAERYIKKYISVMQKQNK